MSKTAIQTPVGILALRGDTAGVTEIVFQDEGTLAMAPKIPEALVPAVQQFKAYFAGKLKDFTFKLNPVGTDFQQEVWRALCQIPYGDTISYLELAKRIGDAKAVRAVAAANGKNPLPIVIPCHRVIGSDGSLTGYASGLWRKKWLLEHEKALKQLSLF